jgi:hypothetical protein
MHTKDEIYTCSICNTEINTAESKMIIDRDENLNIRGTLCVDCYSAICRDDPFVLLRAIEYILLGGYPEEFEDDGDVPRPKKVSRGLTEQDRDLLEKRIGVREFTTLRDDEFSIPKLKGRRKAAPKKKRRSQESRKKETDSETKSEQQEHLAIGVAA